MVEVFPELDDPVGVYASNPTMKVIGQDLCLDGGHEQLAALWSPPGDLPQGKLRSHLIRASACDDEHKRTA